MLHAHAITKRFPGVLALDGVDFEVRAGEVHALVGENGAGKSTLVKILGGALAPTSGSAELDGERLPFGDPVATRARGLGIIYQETMLVPELDVAENVFLGRERTRRGWLARGAMRAEAEALLARLGVACDPRMKAASLGVGLQQLVEVARALVLDAKALIFDEPSTALSGAEAARLFAVIGELRARGLAIVYISHRLDEVFELADRVTVLRDGKTVAAAAVKDVDRRQLIRWMVGRDLAEEFPPRAATRGMGAAEPGSGSRKHAAGAHVLAVRGLSCPPYFADVSFELRRGEILGLAGLVGAGRTSVGLALFGALEAAGGEVRLADEVVRFAHPFEALAAGVAYLSEDRKLAGIFAELGVDENIAMPHLARFGRGGLLDLAALRKASNEVAGRFRVGTGASDDASRRDDRSREAQEDPTGSEDLVELPDPGFEHGLERPMRTLSGGNQQKALLARSLLAPLRVLVLDEPTRGVDVGARAEIYRIVRDLVSEGLAVLMISSELEELLGMCDRIAVMREGRTTGVLDAAEASQERILELATRPAPHTPLFAAESVRGGEA